MSLAPLMLGLLLLSPHVARAAEPQVHFDVVVQTTSGGHAVDFHRRAGRGYLYYGGPADAGVWVYAFLNGDWRPIAAKRMVELPGHDLVRLRFVTGDGTVEVDVPWPVVRHSPVN
jgi:hypothetical protein